MQEQGFKQAEGKQTVDEEDGKDLKALEPVANGSFAEGKSERAAVLGVFEGHRAGG